MNKTRLAFTNILENPHTLSTVPQRNGIYGNLKQHTAISLHVYHFVQNIMNTGLRHPVFRSFRNKKFKVLI